MGLALLAAAVLLAMDVSRDLRQLSFARSDNVQWNLAQVEVEFLEFQSALSNPHTNTFGLNDLRGEFDILYSRLNVLQGSNVFAPLRETPTFASNLTAVRAFVSQTLPLIDADDATLLTALPKLRENALEIRQSVRRLAGSGLAFFAQKEDESRARISATLSQLAGVVSGLLVALLCVSVFMARLNASNMRRSREIVQTSQRMNTVIQTSLDAVIVSDHNGNIIEFNEAAELIFGYDATSVRGQNLSELIVPDDLRDAHDAGMERMRAGGEKHVVGKGRVQLKAKRKNGGVFPVELAIQTAQTEDDTIFIAFLRDVSDRVTAQEALVEARDRALANEKMKSDFLAVMSHEIRTPLNGLLGNLALLHDTKLDPPQSRFVRNMETSGRLLMNHISDVLDIAKYDAGKLVLRPEPMCLSTLMQDIVDTQAGAAGANQSVIEWLWVNTPFDWINADASRLQNVLMNLVGNAVKFTKKGRICIELESQTSREGTPMVEFRVIDTGIGMDEALKARVFQDFVAGNTAYDRDVGGTGLGLGIAKRFAAALDGTIGVESTLGHGSMFWVRIPVSPVDAPQLEYDQTLHMNIAKQLDILVVEDNEINRAVLTEMLNMAGHQVTVATNGLQAVQLAHDHRYDMIFMDISMPEMDGPTACRAIRSQRAASGASPIIAVTASALQKERQAFLAAGMNGVLTKPLSRAVLLDVLANCVSETHPTSEIPQMLSRPQFDELREALGDTATAGMAKRFIQEAEWLLDWLEECENLPNAEVVERVHKVAGSAAIFGAVAFRAFLQEIEALAKEGRGADIRPMLPDLSERWLATASALHRTLAA